MNYSDLLKKNKELGEILRSDKYRIWVFSNIITVHLNEILECTLRAQGINAHVQSGNYDNIVQDSMSCDGADLVVIFWELSNLTNGLQYKADSMSKREIDMLLLKVQSELDLVFKNIENKPLVLFNKFSSLAFNCEYIRKNMFDKIGIDLNTYVEKKALSNTIVIDIDKIIAEVSITESIDLRYYYSSKALYTVEFYKRYAEYIRPIILSIHGKSKKALIFDCDNTLWKGILGEDGFDGIEMSSKTQNGVIFEEIQYCALKLAKQGVILGICSKNNIQDVDEVLIRHPDMKIRDEHVTIKKINWNDKVLNLKEIAKELNIGLDSLVFVDDSSFDVDFVKAQLPQVTVLQVPEDLCEYAKIFKKHMESFFVLSESQEDTQRSKMYKQQAERESEKAVFSNLEDYLSSLGLQLTIYVNSCSLIPRMAQMTQKTNQFNLTTRRYTESDIEKFITDDRYKLFAFDLSDKFGCYGIAGLCIFQLDGNKKSGSIDSFLMSCRVIGRNIELSFFNFIIDSLRKIGVEEIKAKYVKTLKNGQVADFYEMLGFEIIAKSDDEKSYRLKVSQYKPKDLTYVEVRSELQIKKL